MLRQIIWNFGEPLALYGTIYTQLHPMKKKNSEIFPHYRWLFNKGDVIIDEWEIFGAEVFLHYG